MMKNLLLGASNKFLRNETYFFKVIQMKRKMNPLRYNDYLIQSDLY